jgi:uncharacterized protein (DUF433 family)
MVEILGEFPGPRPRQRIVVPLHRPTAGLAVNPEVRGGYPVIEGTRVPYDVVATLVDDGVAAEDIAGFYPSVGVAGARGAVAFARYVDEYRRSISA